VAGTYMEIERTNRWEPDHESYVVLATPIPGTLSRGGPVVNDVVM
jgi:hypothetical protein